MDKTAYPTDAQISACLRASYGLAVEAIAPLPPGYDSYARVYRVQAGGRRCFLKVKAGVVDEMSVLLPRFLHDQGLESVVAPLPTITGKPWGTVGGCTLILYSFIDGVSGGRGLTDAQWTAFGALLRQIHEAPLPPDLLRRLSQETFIPHPRWMAVIQRLQAGLDAWATDHPAERRLIAFWQDHRREVAAVIAGAEGLGRRLRDRSPAPAMALCHADIHTHNLLVDGQGRLFVVDWDEAVRAPRERDLQFVTVGPFLQDTRQEALFFDGYGRGYGPADIDPLIMAYYRYSRTMEDLSAFAESALLLDVDDAVKLDSVEWFERILADARRLPPIDAPPGGGIGG